MTLPNSKFMKRPGNIPGFFMRRWMLRPLPANL